MAPHSNAPVIEADEKSNTAPPSRRPSGRRYKVWIDLENSPHIPFFDPIIRELKAQGCDVVLTARDCFQVCELADLAGFDYKTIGHHYGKNRLAKVYGLGVRVMQLVPFVLGQKPDISVSHGSRSLIVASGLMGIPTVMISDYEHADSHFTISMGNRRKKWVLTPEVIPARPYENMGLLPERILHYPGIKEDVYVPFFQPDPALKQELGIAPSDLVVTLRPPATEAHYHNPESEKLLAEVFAMFAEHPEVKTIVLPRTAKQEAELRHTYADGFASGRIMVPPHAVNGLNLIWYSDVVISGGGTMNREAAALGIPVYSLFRGKLGAVDHYLSTVGKLTLLSSVADVRSKLRLVRRDNSQAVRTNRSDSLDTVVSQIFEILQAKV
ncbi:MAG TPA: DUF354 domain-containing protein [Acidobacteriaceae bacterium]|jgi:hypothetical protein|nr:DUF354 domain-containing protein [Acidobacteriaceae bacterium]